MKKQTAMPEIGTKEFNETADSIFGGSVGKKQTAVQWLAEQMMHPHIHNPYIEQALEKEKEQIIDAHKDGKFVSRYDNIPESEHYYNSTYNQD